MDRHIHTAGCGCGDYCLQEVFQIIPQILLGHAVVLSHHLFQFFPGVAGIPARKCQVAVTGKRIHLVYLLLVVYKGGRAVRQHMVKLCPGPVKDGHKVIADTFDACLCKSFDIFTVVGNIAVSCRLAQLDILMYGNALNDFKVKASLLCLLFKLRYTLPAPDLSHRDIIDCSHNGVHTRNLTDIFQCDLVLFSIPTK